MSDNAASGSANGQYDSDVFGFGGNFSDTGAPGSSAGSTYGAYDKPGNNSTGAPGSAPGSVARDGGSASATDVFGYLNGGEPTVSGTSNTNAEALAEPFTKQNVTKTGIGSGEAGSSHTSPADQSAPWENV